MADRRCISKQIFTQKSFLELPVSTRDLYTYLVLFSDIDGVVEAYSVMNMIKANVNDLQLLDSRGYVRVLNEDWVTYITNFTDFNTLDGRGMKGSSYRELLVETFPDVKLTELKEKKRKQNKVYQGTTKGIPCTTQFNSTQFNSTQPNSTSGTDSYWKALEDVLLSKK